ncbi:MAG: MASE3 domain-containing protein [bacterium]|jgi:PAS domain S-box-containing protein
MEASLVFPFLSYLQFHALIEVTSIAVCLMLFILTWNARGYLGNDYLKLVGVGYAFIALIDLLHTISYKGMNVFPGYGANLPTQLWIAARSLQAVTLCAAPLFVVRRLDDRALLGGYAVAVLGLTTWVFSGKFPDCYIEGKGLTLFKVGSEYAITAVLLAALYLLYRKRENFKRSVFLLVAFSIGCTAASEISFTAYVNVYGFANATGHLFKFAAFYLIYRGILVTGLKEPYELIFRELKQSEQALQKAHDNLEEQVGERTAALVAANANLEEDITERKRAEAALRESEERYRMVFENSPVSIWEEDFSGVKSLFDDLKKEGVTDIESYFARHPETIRQCADMAKIIDVNRAALALHAAANKKELLAGLVNTFTPESFDTFRQELVCLWNGGTEMTRDSVVKTLAGDTRNVTVSFSVCPGYEGTLSKALVSLTDITERKRVEEKRLSNLRIFECMDKVNRAIQGQNDLEQLMSDVLEIVLSIFDCDRAWLFYPCDPDAPSFRVPMEITKPEYPGAGILNVDVPMPTDMTRNLREALESSAPVTYAVGTEKPINKMSAERFGVKSMMMGALYPKSGKPWVFGLHQCSYPRIWRTEEKRIFQEIGRRLADGLTGLLSQRDLQESEAKYRRIVDTANEGIWVLGPDTMTTFVNARMAEMFGYSREEMNGRPMTDFMFEEDVPDHNGRMENRRLGMSENYEHRYCHKDGKTVWTLASATPVFDDAHQFQGSFAMFTDITERKRVQEALRESEQKYRLLVANADEGIYIAQDGVVKFPNPKVLEVTGYSAEELAGVPFIDLIHPEDRGTVLERYIGRLQGRTPPETYPLRVMTKSGEEIWVQLTAVLIDWEGRPGVLCFLRDITKERNLEAQFLQAQKMEAVGRLAGGVAHDFNNLLTVTLGYCDLALGRIGTQDPLRHDLEEIRKASDRCAVLTRQLLAFSRKQILVPKVVNLGDVVADMDKMLRRLIGEDIDLVSLRGKDLWNVKADPGQIEQVIVNLAVNSRDAMPRGGKLTIETSNVVLDETYVRGHTYVSPGSYVMLAVSDTGSGMEARTVAHIFDPFFTTKARGTGLGLSTVYGIVKQSDGHINVYSEPGIGTTFKIYFPHVEEKVTEISGTGALPLDELRGSETILVVEDEELVRQMVREILVQYGYTVLEARNGDDAVEYCSRHREAIHLMLTDVVMPGMNGMELSNRLAPMRPEMKVLFMSGYTANAIVHQGVLDAGIPFIHKPFTMDSLAHKVREVMDAN